MFAAAAVLAAVLSVPAGAVVAPAATAAPAGTAACEALAVSDFGDPEATAGAGDAGTCHALTLTPGRYAVSVADDQFFTWAITDAADATVCTGYIPNRGCVIPAAGDYTLRLTYNGWGGSSAYRVAVVDLGSAGGCAPSRAIGWDLPARTGVLTSPLQLDCLPFDARTGDVVFSAAQPDTYLFDFYHWIVDATGADACDPGYPGDGCRLAGAAPYRQIVTPRGWPAGDVPQVPYRTQAARLFDPAGCPVVTPGAYGGAPGGAVAGVRCRAITVPAAGDYRFRMVTERNSGAYATVYDLAGNRVCGGEICTFPAAGTYVAVRDPLITGVVIDVDVRYAATFLPKAPTSGCVTVADRGAYRDRLDAVGAWDCLRLTAPAGARIAAAWPDDAPTAALAEMQVVDAAGAWVCDTGQLVNESCLLTGVAPFALLTSARSGTAGGDYGLTVTRVDPAAGCTTLPAGGSGVTVATGPDGYLACLTVPAGHADSEQITWTRVAGSGDARVRTFSPEGFRRCRTVSFATYTVTCTLPAGVNTLLLQADALPAEYTVSRRPVS
ncbi:hypothetical protein JCM9533A_32080 [Catenuloplanes niger JCM 9533]